MKVGILKVAVFKIGMSNLTTKTALPRLLTHRL